MDATEVELDRRRLLRQRGIVLTGTSTVTAGLAFQTLNFLFAQTTALAGLLRFTAVGAIVCFALSAILSLLAVDDGADLRAANASETQKLTAGAVLMITGIGLLALTAIVFAF